MPVHARFSSQIQVVLVAVRNRYIQVAIPGHLSFSPEPVFMLSALPNTHSGIATSHRVSDQIVRMSNRFHIKTATVRALRNDDERHINCPKTPVQTRQGSQIPRTSKRSPRPHTWRPTLYQCVSQQRPGQASCAALDFGDTQLDQNTAH